MSASSHRRLATDAWESLLRTQVAMMRELHKEPEFKAVGGREYDVLFNLSTAPNGWLRMNELLENVLLTQPSISRLVDRLEAKGWVERRVDSQDRRGVQIRLTPAGSQVQKRVGRAHVKNIASLMGKELNDTELKQLLEITAKLRKSLDN